MQNSIDNRLYRELRCPNCHRLIIKEYIFQGYISYECHRCGEKTTFHFKHKYNGKMDLSSEEPTSRPVEGGVEKLINKDEANYG